MKQLYALLQITDSSFPSGAFAHSGGFEGFLAQAGPIAGDEFAALLRDVWKEQLLHSDGALGLASYRAARRGDLEGICDIDRRLYALKLNRELRVASVRTGTSFLTEASRLLRAPLVDAYAAAVDAEATPGNYATTFMTVCAATDIGEEASLLAWGYQVVTQLSAALLRLGVIGHRVATALVAQLKPDIEAGIRELVVAEEVSVSSFAPLLEIASMAHERQYSRLFQS